MADNYLEKHYAEYEARKAAWERARKLGKKKLHAIVTPVKGTKAKEPDSSSAE